MEFLEFRCDESHRASGVLAARSARDTGFPGICSRLGKYGQILQAATIVLLCAMVSLLILQQKHVHELETARGELRATVSETRERLQLLSRKLDSLGPERYSTVQQVGLTSKTAASTEPAQTRPPAQQRKDVAIRQDPASKTRSQSIGARNYRNFSLGLSRQFTRIGPIEVSLRSVDAKRKCVSLSIVSNSGKGDFQCIRLNQLVWINVGYRRQRLGFVADRIAGHILYGHLIEPQDDRPDLRATRLKSGPQASP
jgi:hypothetical protein